MEFPELVNRQFPLESWNFNRNIIDLLQTFIFIHTFFLHFSILKMTLRIKIKRNLYGDSNPWRRSPEQGSTYPSPRRSLDSYAFFSITYFIYRCNLYNLHTYYIFTHVDKQIPINIERDCLTIAKEGHVKKWLRNTAYNPVKLFYSPPVIYLRNDDFDHYPRRIKLKRLISPRL